MRWNHIVNKRLFSNTTFTYSRYRFNIFNELEESETRNGETNKEKYSLEYLSGIRDLGVKVDFDYLPNPDHYVRTGVNVIHHKFNPGAAAFENLFEEESTDLKTDPTYAVENAVYVEDDYKVNNQLKINAGLHFSGFLVNEKYYNSLQPRLSARYLLTPSLSAKASYAQMAQFIHLLTNSGIGMPTDLRVPSTENIKPQKSQQVALGLAKSIDSRFEVSLEGYYKHMDNLIEYKEGASFLNVDKNWENKITSGEGWSYGMEAFVQKKTGQTTGWIGYTLSWTNRQFEELNFGKIFPYKYDRRHDISVIVTHKFNEKTELSGTWVYGTGVALTLPTGKYKAPADPTNPYNLYQFMDSWNSIDNFSERNEYRMPHYHRMDIGLTRFKKTKWGERRWVFGVYNAYNRANPFYMEVGYDDNGRKKFIQYSLFQFIPSVSYNFSF